MTIDTETKPHTGALARAVGAQIRAIRKQKGMTLNDLARASGTTPQTIQRLEMGTMTLSVDWIESICTALGAEPYELFPHPDKNISDQIAEIREEAEIMRVRSVYYIERLETFLKGTES